MTEKTKNILSIAVLIILAGAMYVFLPPQNSTQQNAKQEISKQNENPSQIIQKNPPLPPDSTPLPPDSNSVFYVKAGIVSVDLRERKIAYKQYAFNTVSAESASMTFPKDIPVYRVDDDAKVSIANARATAILSDLKPGQIVFIKVENKPAQDGKFVPQEFVIISEK